MIRFALLGCGKIARRHANLLAKACVPGATLAAVCDVDLARAAALGQEYGVPFFDNPVTMMRETPIDAVSVLTPSGSHARDVTALADFKKPIVVEKPMALTLDDADRMIEACDHAGCRLFVVKQNRFNLPVVKLREALVAGRLGKLVLGTVRVRWCRPQAYYDEAAWRGTWANDGGVLANQASHHVDLLTWMMGDVESVHGMGITALANIEAEDTAVVTLRFRNGALGIIEATTATRPKDLEGSISILGSQGSVEIGGFALNELKVWQFSQPQPDDATAAEQWGRNPDHPFGYAHAQYYAHVVDCVESNRHQLVDGLEGRRSLELITAIYESIETGDEVKLRFRPSRCRLGMAPKGGPSL
jgi:UDP-N-acetyl-2-amino-2-deoxyglucuronate dehydrogenase